MAEATVNQQALAGAEGQGMVAVARTPNPIDAIAGSRVVRQFSKLIGLAAAIAVGTVVALWTAEPNFVPVATDLSGKSVSQVADQLTASGIEYRIDASDNTLLVDQSRETDARLILGTQGVSSGKVPGMEMLGEEQGLGTSQDREAARYLHAKEVELVRTIESFQPVESARVHLAIPKQSIFIRDRSTPTASVFVNLRPGRVLNRGQVEAIVQMVASSVSMMDSRSVKVVDQFGRLLTDEADDGMGQTSRQFDYQRRLENRYVDNIINLLQPIVGEGRVNAQVAAQLDFAAVESTREAFDPERSVIRSEQVEESISRSIGGALGIPGALSNQPPPAAEVEGEEGVNEEIDAVAVNDQPENQNRSRITNREVDRIVSHTSNPVGTIQRLSVAVVIDDKLVAGEDGTSSKTPYTEEEIARFENLVRETIGFNEIRGDSISVINASFLEVEPPAVEPVPAWQSLLEEAWIVNLVKQVLGALGLLLVYFIFIRPLLRSLSLKPADDESAPAAGAVQTLAAPAAMPGQAYAPQAGIPSLGHDSASQAALMRRKDATYDQKVDMARGMVMDDPARVANVMKQWVGEE